MPVIVKTEGIVLNREMFRSTSKIISLFSKDYGRLELLAKGGFDPKKGWAGSLEPFAFSEVVFYRREGKEYYLISDITLIFDFFHFRQDEKRFYFAYLLSSFIIKNLPREIKQLSLYQLFLSTLFLLDREGQESFLYAFLLKASVLLGYQPNLFSCLRCAKRLDSFFFSSDKGGFLCRVCQEGKGIDFQSREAKKLKELLLLPQREIGKIELGEKEKKAIQDFLAHHLNFFFPANPFSA